LKKIPASSLNLAGSGVSFSFIPHVEGSLLSRAKEIQLGNATDYTLKPCFVS